MSQHSLKVDVEALLQVFRKGIFREPEVVVREILFNAHDACMVRQEFDTSFKDPRIDVLTDVTEGTLTFADNGMGMTMQELHENFSTIGGSSKRALRGGEHPLSLIGGFGVGSLAAASIADLVEVVTKSARPSASGLKWVYAGSRDYRTEEVPKSDVGTTFILHLREEYRRLLEVDRLEPTVAKYAGAISTPVYLNRQGVEPLRPGDRPVDTLFSVSALHRTPVSPRRLVIVPRTPTPERYHFPYEIREEAESGRHRKSIDRNDQLSRIRLDIDGHWTVGDFTSLLKQVNDIYARLWSGLFVAEVLQSGDIAALVKQVEVATLSRSEGEDLARFIGSTTRTMPALSVLRIAVASPGLIELIGSLNPLKLLADFITNWRHENTIREQNARQADLERLKVDSEVTKKLLEVEFDIRNKSPNHQLIERYLQHTLVQSFGPMTDVARDIRLVGVSLELFPPPPSKSAQAAIE